MIDVVSTPPSGRRSRKHRAHSRYGQQVKVLYRSVRCSKNDVSKLVYSSSAAVYGMLILPIDEAQADTSSVSLCVSSMRRTLLAAYLICMASARCLAILQRLCPYQRPETRTLLISAFSIMQQETHLCKYTATEPDRTRVCTDVANANLLAQVAMQQI